MTAEAIEHYLADRTRHAAPAAGAFTGSAGGAPCGDLIRISVEVRDGLIAAASQDAEGCAASRAAAAAVAELVEGGTLLEAAAVGPDQISDELGGLGSTHRHSAELSADALHRALSALAGSGQPLAPMPVGAERVLIALSGGVDSAVAALIERERGAEVVAVTLKLWADRATDGEKSCCSPEAVLRARRVAHSLGIPHLTLDLEPEFRAGVVQPFIDGHVAGTTPNPCVLCNGEVRIDAMIALADRLGASALVTGHYARIADDGDGPLLSRPADDAKDQTYMLSALGRETLARLRFPLGELRKPEVRRLAAEAGLAAASKAESQDLCFLAGEGKRAFLARHAGLGDRPGPIVDRAGSKLGEHPGHHHFTVGQRRGIGLGAPEPLYVLATDAESNQVVVGRRDELATPRVRVRAATLHRPGGRVDGVKLRYRSRALACRVTDAPAGDHEELELELGEPAYGVAPGQSACLMDGELVVGQGTISG